MKMESTALKKTLLLCCAIVLWGCDTPGSYGPESPYFRYPEGSRLILKQKLEIPANWATARLQYGKVVPFGHVQEQAPHCIFEINTVSSEPQYVEPDTFAIIKVQRSFSSQASLPGYFIKTVFGGSDRPTQMFYKTIFTLKSERQPGVLRMICQSDQYAAGISIPRDLTLAEIRQALGNIFTLEIPNLRT